MEMGYIESGNQRRKIVHEKRHCIWDGKES